MAKPRKAKAKKQEAPPDEGGVRYSRALADKICARLATGATLNQVCKEPGMPCHSVVRKWASDDHDGFHAKYARAREVGYQVMADDLVDIADEKSSDPQRDRLRVDTRKWLLAKALPKIYGDKQTVEHTGDAFKDFLASARKAGTSKALPDNPHGGDDD